MDGYAYTIELAVRDYECDVQGIVNNSVYQNYLEHARHEYLKTEGLDFVGFARAGINLVVVRAELDYRYPLRSGDRFIVALNIHRDSPLRFAFYQDIFRIGDHRLILNAKITGTALRESGRPGIPDSLDRLFSKTGKET